MCNLSVGIYEDGMQEGLKKGIEQGIEQGIEKGIEQGIEKVRLDTIRNLMEALGESAQAIMEKMKIPVEDRSRLLKLLGQE